MALSDIKVFMEGGKKMMRYAHLKMTGFYDEQADEIINNQDDKRNQLILHIADNFDLIHQSSFEVWEMMQKFGFLGATSSEISLNVTPFNYESSCDKINLDFTPEGGFYKLSNGKKDERN